MCANPVNGGVFQESGYADATLPKASRQYLVQVLVRRAAAPCKCNGFV
jgi:hypothetical protein